MEEKSEKKIACQENLKSRRVAFLWDESFLWGVISFRVLRGLSLHFDLITAGDVKSGMLSDYEMLFVPGGWATDKSNALGEDGKKAIRKFVEDGGSYLGFCGGAGLALEVENGLSLLPVTRKRTRERTPNFSGKIQVYSKYRRHPLWRGIPKPLAFYVWWPSQFSITRQDKVSVLACYNLPESDFFVSDLCVSDINRYGDNWKRWEDSYGIRLNPFLLQGEPAVLEGKYGSGKIILSLIHFDTPDDSVGNRVLFNLWQYLLPAKSGKKLYTIDGIHLPNKELKIRITPEILDLAQEMEMSVRELIAFGERNLLWYWRNHWMLQWRRGIRGFEYCTLFILLSELSRLIQLSAFFDIEEDNINIIKKMKVVEKILHRFLIKAKELLIEEKYAMNYGLLNIERDEGTGIQSRREELFSSSKRYGGMFKQLIDSIDALLVLLLRKSQFFS
ncbi:MAG: BPL-N domain-containing protein [Nitrospirota bacterium]